jgi:hypothetical protein
MKYFGSLYPNRIAWLDHVFFCIGNGYDWLDGALIRDPDSHITSRRQLKAMEKEKKLMKKVERLISDGDLKSSKDTLDDANSQLWGGNAFKFYPICEQYSNVCCVPDDVRPDWLAAVYEAAILLRDKSGIPNTTSKWIRNTDDDVVQQENNRKVGAKVVDELEKRFPQLVVGGK